MAETVGTMQKIGAFMAGVLPPEQPTPQRPFIARFAFRSTFLYFFLSTWMWLDELLTGQTFLIRHAYLAVENIIVPWVAAHLLHIQHPVQKHVLYDTTFAYVEILCWMVLSVVLATLWSLWDKRGKYDPLLHDLLRTFLRYTVAWIMVIYAWNKIIDVQFNGIELPRLVQPYGDSSPMALFWAFMGYSHGYAVFGGLAELSGSIALLFRRTTTLGALILLGVIGNVTLINLAYDVPVKLLTLSLMLMVLMLLAPDIARLTNFLVLNRPVKPVELGGLPRARGFRLAKLALKSVILLDMLLPMPIRNIHRWQVEGPDAPKPQFYGIYVVDGLTENGQLHPPLLTDSQRLRYLIIDRSSQMIVRRMDESADAYRMSYDAKNRRMTIQSKDGQIAGAFAVTQTGADSLELKGNMGSNSLDLQLRRMDDKKTTLMSRGFHWISESSYYK
jgi:hypothetical protein